MNFYFHSKIRNITENNKSNKTSNPEFKLAIVLVRHKINIISEAIILHITNFCYPPIFILSEQIDKNK